MRTFLEWRSFFCGKNDASVLCKWAGGGNEISTNAAKNKKKIRRMRTTGATAVELYCSKLSCLLLPHADFSAHQIL